jgi:hypothetical protein
MEKIRVRARRFFTGLGRLVPLIPAFVWIALSISLKSVRAYWKRSQKVVEQIADDYMREEMHEEKTTEYNFSLYQICYAIAAFLYLLIWLAMSWLTVEAFRQLASLTVEAFRFLTSWIP